MAGIGAREEAFRAVYDAEFANIAGYCFLMLRNEEQARDIAQEAFTRLLAKWLTVREPRPWLFQVATNLVRDKWRRETREREFIATIEEPDATAGPDLAVRDAVTRLPRAHRDAVCLFYFADLPIAMVARTLGRPEGSIKRLLFEARGMLAVALGDGHV